jgi:hypothetical protein
MFPVQRRQAGCGDEEGRIIILNAEIKVSLNWEAGIII